MSDYLRPLSSVRLSDKALAGAKAASLGELRAAGLPVPEGVCILAPALSLLLEKGTLPPEVEEKLSTFSPLSPFAVRSSATVEDSAAFAGVFETVLGARGPEEIKAALLTVASSLRSERAQAAFLAAKKEPGGMAALLQPLLPAEISGVMLTRDPSEPSLFRIEAVPGEGEALVSGRTTPELVLCHRETLRRSPKSRPHASGTLLTPPQIETLAKLAREIERVLGEEETWEIEWIFSAGACQILQARPARSRAEVDLFVWDQGHNPAPLSEAQAAMARALDARGKVPFRLKIIDGYLFVGPRPYAQLVHPRLSPEFVEQFEEEISANILEPILDTPYDLEDAMDRYLTFCEGYFSGILSGPRQVLDELHSFLKDRGLLPGMANYPPEAPASDPVALLMAGTRTKSFRKDAALFAVANLARKSEAAQKTALENKDPGDDPAALRVKDLLREFFALYGDESFGWDICLKTLREDPSPVREVIRGFLENPSPSPEERRRKAARQAASLAELLVNALPEEDRAAFLDKVTFARQLFPLMEEDDLLFSRAQGFLRRKFLEEGRAAGLEDPEDAFWVDPQDLLQKIPAEELSKRAKKARALAESRAARPPLPLPALSGKEALPGEAASGGVARGKARILRDLSHPRLEPGEILVVSALVPSLAHLLLFAAGLVAEHGGTLSHAAALAREYGIPAVVGVSGATRILQDGDLIEVDGNAGTIRRA